MNARDALQLAALVAAGLFAATPLPAGEDCIAPTPIAVPGSVTGDTTGARDDLRLTCTGFDTSGPDHVYTYTPTAGEVVDVILTPLAPDYDASLYVLTGCSACAGGADRYGMGSVEAIEFLPLAAGIEHQVVVDGFPFFSSEDHGPYRLELRPSVIPEDCASARPVRLVPGSDALDTTFGRDDLGAAPGCGLAAQAGPDLVYRLDPVFAGSLEVRLRPFGFDASLYAVDACGGSCLAGSDLPGAGAAESISLPVSPGVPVYVVVDGVSGGGRFEIDFVAGEDCALPMAVESVPFTASGDASVAANDLDLRGRACTGFRTNSPDVVYTLAAASDAFVDLTVTPLDGGYDVALYVIRDCAAPDATCVAGADQGLDGEAEGVQALYLLPEAPLLAVIDSGTFEFDQGTYELAVTAHLGTRLFAIRQGEDVRLRFAGDRATYQVLRDGDRAFPSPIVLSPAEPGPFFDDRPGTGRFFYRVE